MSDSDNWFDKDIEEFKAPVRKIEAKDPTRDSQEDLEGSGGSSSVPFVPPGEDYGGSYNVPMPTKTPQTNAKQSKKSKKKEEGATEASAVLPIPPKKLQGIVEMDSVDIFVEIMSKLENFTVNAFEMDKSFNTTIILIRILAKIHEIPLNYNVEHIMNQIMKPNDALLRDIHSYVVYAADLEEKNLPNLLSNAHHVWNDLEIICMYGVKYRGGENLWENLARMIFNVLKEKSQSSLLDRSIVFGKILEDMASNYFYPEAICGSLREVNELEDLPKVKRGKKADTQKYLEYHFLHLKSIFMQQLHNGVKSLRLCGDELKSGAVLRDVGGTNVFPCVRIRKSFFQFMAFKDKYFLLDLAPHMRNDEHAIPDDVRKDVTSREFLLQPGSLIFLSTSSAFENMIVAEIPYLPDEIQKEGFLIIDILQMENIEECILNRDLILVTIPILFEPIYQNLKALKRFSTKTLPMGEYFVNYEKSPRLPDGIYKQKNFEALGMNEKQFEAFTLALTQKLSLIQGPPGTGKTSVALNIVQHLLPNTSLRILVVTYRNLALDKFLLECSAFTEKIVRLGHQFADPAVKKFSPDKSLLDQRYRHIKWKSYSEYREIMEKFVDEMKCLDVGDSKETILESFNNLRKATMRLNQLSTLDMYHSCRDARIIGMTTSGAARNHELLELLRPQIVIMEEAAEVPESHIITTLTEFTEKLILIGDHKQLFHNFDANLYSSNYTESLFGRLIGIGVQNVCLNVQYRMHPDIADLIRPTIYKGLKDGENVKQYKAIKGVVRNLFCISHKNLESLAEERYAMLKKEFPMGRNASTSKENFYEMLFTVGLANYLRQQGYQSHEVVILTTYSGQQAATASILMQFPWLKEVEVHTVDSFQGQECRIVILSLVRSNQDGNIGFLINEQRLCVLLTRAKEGLYIVGNMDLLVKKSDIWGHIERKLKEKQAIGPGLPIKCEKHSCEMIATGMEDFLKFSRDGCPVGEKLPKLTKNPCLDNL
ncbi:NFX1-type zinc finger-containing protein 1-like [Lutzomyia longipalpis]|uniref:NFX1-type zinc finger-containing protein 1-like n=1 Tax=Lutzomyia longipalpis TaxID=7200 RepID=UPI0024841145|nr:NFX1-type zinc finger-containing protein 1-like [Lutzomyia longipalpis]